MVRGGWSINREKNRMLIPDNAPEQLAVDILSLAKNRELRNYLSENGRRLVCKYYDLKRIVANYELLFQHLVCNIVKGL